MGFWSTLFQPEQSNGHKEPQFGLNVDIPLDLLIGESLGGISSRKIGRVDALNVPAVLRSRNLIAGTLATLPIHVRDKARQMASPTTLLEQIDPDLPNVVTLAQTYEDLLFEAVSWWRVTEFGWHGFPTFARHVEPSRVYVSPNGVIYVDGLPTPDTELIRFDSPNPSLLVHAARAIRTCLALDAAAAMYANEPLPLGYFAPKPEAANIDDEEVQALLDKWEEARRSRAWGYVNGALEAKTLQFDAEQIQLADQRQHAVLEIARATGVDPEDLGVSTTSRTYQNAEQRRQDLLDFSLSAYVAAVEQRLSMRDVLPRGYKAKVNLDGFLRSDTKTRMETYAIGAPLGVYTEDEMRELEDKPPLTDAERAAMTPREMETSDE